MADGDNTTSQNKWYVKNKARILEDQKKKRAENPEKHRAQRREYYARNPGAHKECAKRHYRKYASKYSRLKREYVAKNKERLLAAQRKNRGLPEPTRPCPALCECCGGSATGKGSLHLDHCHKTGKFRGWLCHRCNFGLGHFFDDPERLKLAIKYLLRETI